MSLALSGAAASDSPASSGRNSPVPRVSRQAVQEEAIKTDKSVRRYASNIEKALSTWETAPDDWADYIAFLGRLLKALQSHPKDVNILPHSDTIAARLSQCLSASLPSGVHQKALEVYSYIFEVLGPGNLATHLSELLPGLSSVLSFASLSVRPSLYVLYEDHILRLSDSQLRPALKSLVLSLLPALEDETSEDFERALSISLALNDKFARIAHSSYFWQCVFLAVITSPTRRQGALNLLQRRLPTFSPSMTWPPEKGSSAASSDDVGVLSNDANLLISPDPGLLLLCFVSGLSDQQLLVQRGFLDLLVGHLPLHSPVLQDYAGRNVMNSLIRAATKILLRRDMSLNRRLWTWFLGPVPKDTEPDSLQSSPVQSRQVSNALIQSNELLYFTRFGLAALEQCLLESLTQHRTPGGDVTQTFRICLALMDRWEIGGTLVPRIFLPVIRSVYNSRSHVDGNTITDMIKSAGMFFDGVESKLIWSALFRLLQSATVSTLSTVEDLNFFHWTVQHFNLQEEEMLTMHIPNAITFLAASYLSPTRKTRSKELQLRLLQSSSTLLALLPDRILHSMLKLDNESSVTLQLDRTEQVQDDEIQATLDSIRKVYEIDSHSSKPSKTPYSIPKLPTLFTLFSAIAAQQLRSQELEGFRLSSGIVVSLVAKVPAGTSGAGRLLFEALMTSIVRLRDEQSLLDYGVLAECVRLAQALNTADSAMTGSSHHRIAFAEALVWQAWKYLSPHRPQYHVEASRLIWQIGDLVKDTDSMQVTLTELLRPRRALKSQVDGSSVEAIQRFTVLWTHSVSHAGASTLSGPRTPSRRSSSTWSIHDLARLAHQQDVLQGLLWICLDALDDERNDASECLRHWLSSLSSLDYIIESLVAKILQLSRMDAMLGTDRDRAVRQEAQRFRLLDCYLSRLQNMITQVPHAVWRSMSTLELSSPSSESGTDAFMSLSSCIAALLSSPTSPEFVVRTCASLLAHVLASPLGDEVRPLQLESMLIDRVISSLESSHEELQSQLLHLLELALKIRLGPSRPQSIDEHLGSRPQTSGKGGTGSSGTNGINIPSKAAPRPPEKLVACICAGFSSPSARLRMERWLDFLERILALYSDAIFTTLIPLVDCFCDQLQLVFAELVASITLSKESGPVPEATISYLLKALELVLAKAHQHLLDEVSQIASSKPAEAPSGLFGVASQGKYRASNQPSKALQGNSRLTVVLAFHDTVRACLSIWTWASQNVETSHRSSSSALTTSFNALKVRNRSRQLLEEVFNAELLECLEVLIDVWSNSSPGANAETTLRLLQTLACTRPKSTVPAVLDALCSRANPGALAVARQSSVTIDLDAVQISLFLLAYLKSMEDDAMDEVWTDCMTFMRDVLANPMPYRQALPPLLSILVTMSLKLGNTNFGEQKKMRKGIADVFQRLLSAIFTTSSAGSWSAPTTAEVEQQSESMLHLLNSSGASNATVVLTDVLDHVEYMVESQERINTTLSGICTNFISPLIHAKIFPSNVNQEALVLLYRIAKKAPTAKYWKKEAADAFGDNRLFSSQPNLVRDHWLPILQQWAMHDRERIEDVLNRIPPPSSAGIMFGVGANAARIDADRKTQFNLRRICLLMLAAPRNLYVTYIKAVEVKLVELFEASFSSSPSCAVKAELFMLLRALILTFDAVHVTSLWPLINEQLQQALASLLSGTSSTSAFTNLALLQACKLLDTLLTLDVDDFQLYEWLYISDTNDAVYQPPNWQPSALTDQISETLASTNAGDTIHVPSLALAPSTSTDGTRQPMIQQKLSVDSQDIKAMSKEDFAKTVLKPILSQFSIHSYEASYSLKEPDVDACRENLLADLLDISTIAE